MPRSEADINAEKNAKPRPDLVPANGTWGAATAFAVGVWKHGLADNGRGTYRIPKTEQARVSVHMASLERHLLKLKMGEFWDPDVPTECPIRMSHWDAALAQLNICADLIADPPGGFIHQEDRRWYPDWRLIHYKPPEDPNDPWWWRPLPVALLEEGEEED